MAKQHNTVEETLSFLSEISRCFCQFERPVNDVHASLNSFLVLGRELAFTVFAEPYLPVAHRLGLPDPLSLTLRAPTKRANRRSSSWHQHHLYETFKRLWYIKLAILEAVLGTPREYGSSGTCRMIDRCIFNRIIFYMEI